MGHPALAHFAANPTPLAAARAQQVRLRMPQALVIHAGPQTFVVVIVGLVVGFAVLVAFVLR